MGPISGLRGLQKPTLRRFPIRFVLFASYPQGLRLAGLAFLSRRSPTRAKEEATAGGWIGIKAIRHLSVYP